MSPYMFILLICSLGSAVTGKGIGPGEQDFGYVTARPGVHMFWWLFHTTANVTNSAERPLILWLAGGPGQSATSDGNFLMVGPVDENLNPREHTWVKDYNVLFVDNPVGTGFSYVENNRLLNSKNIDIAKDLVETLKGFFVASPKFKTTPFFIYGISYGGKMGTDLALLLDGAIKNGDIECNLKGLTMGNAWISPLDFTEAYGPQVYQFSLVDEASKFLIDEQAHHTRKVFEEGDYFMAKVEWARAILMANDLADGVNLYDLTQKIMRFGSADIDLKTFEEKLHDMFAGAGRDPQSRMDQFMNGPVKEALNIPSFVTWGGQLGDVILNLYVDFIMPVTDSMQKILNNTNIDVHICNGNLDLMVPTSGALKYISKFEWKDKRSFENATRTTIWVNNTMEGYEKHGGRLHFYWLNVASHFALTDNIGGTREFLRAATGV